MAHRTNIQARQNGRNRPGSCRPDRRILAHCRRSALVTDCDSIPAQGRAKRRIGIPTRLVGYLGSFSADQPFRCRLGHGALAMASGCGPTAALVIVPASSAGRRWPAFRCESEGSDWCRSEPRIWAALISLLSGAAGRAAVWRMRDAPLVGQGPAGGGARGGPDAAKAALAAAGLTPIELDTLHEPPLARSSRGSPSW